jgi:hypothetical protein
MAPNLTEKRPPSPPESAGPTKFNPFHPEMPRIPGVSDGTQRANRELDNSGDNRSAPNLQIVVIVAVVVSVGLAVFLWSRFRSRSASGASADPEISGQTTSAPPPAFAIPAPVVHDGPSSAGTVEQLAKPWSAKKFNFVKPITHENIDAIVVRLPSGELWAFSLNAPYGNCTLEYVTDLSAIAASYKFRAVHPMVVNPCDSTVFDPLKVGTIDGNTWARGQVVQGSSLRPPFAIEVKVHGRSIMAEGIE